jgi:hypothetical protein
MSCCWISWRKAMQGVQQSATLSSAVAHGSLSVHDVLCPTSLS